jgi:nitrogenase molybdenum-cofactor synthesis protein NifE
MAYQYSLDKLKRVSEIETAKDIKQLSHAQFPGTHCALFGVALTAGYVKGLYTLVAGTDECTYYTKSFNIERKNSDASMEDNFLSFAVNQDDVVFGCHDKIVAAVIKIDQKYSPKAILLATTCILELIGEDIDAILYSLRGKVKAKILVVRTEHFKCNNHIPGIERTLEAFIGLMEKRPVAEGTINILGHRYDGVEDTELVKILTGKGIVINQVLPSSCSIDSVRSAPAAALNIVSDFTALPLAAKMEEQFGTPYVYFDKYLSLKRIERGYREIAGKLGITLDEEIKTLAEKAIKMQQGYYPLFKGKKFLYANTPLLAFEFSGYLAGIGMEPVLIQARDLYANDDVYLKEIIATGNNPYVSRIANIAPLQTLYDELKPNVYIGHENPMVLIKKGIIQVVLDSVAKKLGFEVPMLVMKAIADSIKKYEFMAKEVHHKHAAL